MVRDAGRYGWKFYVVLSFIAALVVLSYSNAVDTPFHFDDYHSIVFNSNIKDLSNLPLFFTSAAMTTQELKGGYRPMVTTSLALNYKAGELDPRGYHVFNIAAHLAVAGVFFLIALFFVERTGQSPWLALLLSGIYALHPAHTNAVSYIIARSAIICAFFYLLSFYSYIRFRDSGGRSWFAVSAISFIAALLSKENAVTLPLVLFLYDAVVLKEKGPRKYIVPSLFLVAGAVYAVTRLYALTGTGSAVAAPLNNLMAQPYVIMSYLRVFFFPINLNFLPFVRIPSSAADPEFLVPMILVLAMLLLTLLGMRKRGLTAFLIAWFFLTLLPETFSYLPDLMIEYRLYLPSAGLLLAVIPVSAAYSGQRSRRATAILMIAVIALFPLLIHNRNKVYSDDTALWEDVVRKSPSYGEAYAFLGSSYLTAGRNKDAVNALRKAFELNPSLNNGDYYNNLGTAEDLCGNYPEAVSAYKRALEINPDDVRTLRNVGVLMLKMDRRPDAVYYFKRAYSLSPGNTVLKTLIIQAGGDPNG